MQIGQLILSQTDPATQFTEALAQNAYATVSLAAGATIGKIDPGVSAAPSVKSRLQSIAVQSVQNLAWEVWLWRSAQFNLSLTDPSLNHPAGRWSFLESDAVRLGATPAGLYYYYIEGLDHFYVDADNTSKLHVMLVNRSATPKLADASGAIGITFALAPTLGW